MLNKKKSIKQRVATTFGYLILGTAIVGSISGSIYYVYKNSLNIEKTYWSPQKFLEAANKVKVSDKLQTSQSASDLYNSFISQKKIERSKNGKFC
ncbi:hypothetical protein [Mycoplasma struthionis]|uniref:Uncharacterized protein n=1 Tax=Mycoplasma struthionis TaxID=538220 RepID=A0A502M8S5_9MOLU|nr:hypothetical protein [Mycoplasma struthionis]TPI01572.1 hypothetical protein FJM01_02300 [Mycoplasma struthionis]